MNQKGHTLIEMVLAITLMSVLVSAVSVAFLPVLDTWSLNSPKNEITDSVSYAVGRMASEIAQVKNQTSVEVATSSRFKFTDVSNNSVDYTLSGTNLMRNANIMGRGIQSITFTYYDVNDATLVTPTVSPSSTNIWRVSMSVTSQKDGQTQTMDASVHPRNLPRG